MVCGKCGRNNSDNSRYCEHCGEPLLNMPGRNQRRTEGILIGIIIGMAVLVVAAAGIIIYLALSQNTAPNEPVQSTAIDGSTVYQVPEETVPEETDVNGDAPKENVGNVEVPKEVSAPEPPKETQNAAMERLSKKEEFLLRAAEIEEYERVYAAEAITQSDMNRVSGDVYKKWDDLLNDVYQYLKKTLPSEEFERLRTDEREWIKEKESAIEAAAEEWAGGSGEPMARNCAASDSTRERVYYLITLIK